MKKCIAACLLTFIFAACKNEKEPKTSMLPVKSFLLNQIADVDTSLYRIMRIEQNDSTYDTVYVKREDFRELAADFINIPDITEKKYRNHYQVEETYDQAMGRAVFNYMATDEDMEVTNQIVTVDPGSSEGEVKSIYIESVKGNDDSTLIKRLTWVMNDRFQVLKIIQKPGVPEKVETWQVHWR